MSQKSTADHLCSQCQCLNFSPSLTVEADNYPDVPLGTLAAIRSRTWCPCCRLIVAANDRAPAPFNRYADDEEFELGWSYGQDRFQLRGKLLGTFLALVEGDQVSRVRNAREVVYGFADTSVVRKWLDNCCAFHGDACTPLTIKVGNDHDDELRSFRLIDVEDSCLAAGYSCSRYVALSYVWGPVSTVRLGKGILESLMQKGGLESILQELPRTIQDAITLVRRIGERYLWVDTMCLMQDDPDDMSDGVRKMDLIYEGAVLTIVSATGTDANAGLCGITRVRSPTQDIEEVEPGAKMLVLHDIEHHITPSKYATRGWTFQEQLLSKRTLIFVNEMMYFRCRQCIWSEETTDDDSPQRMNESYRGSLLQLALDPDESALGSYNILVQYYSRRELTYESDVINAMAGLLRRLSDRLGPLIKGLPIKLLDITLLWWHRNPGKRRTSFPSYSWAGWEGEVLLKVDDLLEEGEAPSHTFFPGRISAEEWLKTKTWIKWDVIQNQSQLHSWTWSVNLEVRGQEVFDDQGRCGYIDVGRKEGGHYEFLLLSEARYRVWHTIVEQEEFSGEDWDLYWVMLVETQDGVSERRAIGQVEKRVKAMARWKEFQLR